MMSKGDNVLIRGASGSVGLAAVHMASRIRNVPMSRPLAAVLMTGRPGEAKTQANTDYQRRAFLAPYRP